ncbi:SRPBCC family protein [Saccharopolyspora endophytica]|uniref:SRPBCC family protein n=1 Tax=Saccharopolyspora endophytica TaxID=543886 RepID=A0ABS5DL11_9PSEU|nr:SRPBCC family protein [Saccharopolyspora endophytica]MBQ0926976.1 SRPBCC family protein [Saccharopolyspora endophytica]
MNEIVDRINAVHRELGTKSIPAGEGKVVLLRRSYDATVEDVWDACTDPERLARWFLPVAGELRVGGKYQLEGNAGGEILRCEPPRLLKVTWVLGENPTEKDVSEVELRLSAGAGGAAVLELEHAAVVDPDFWGTFGPGAVGVGWDTGLHGLAEHVAGEDFDEDAWQHTPEAKDFLTRSSRAWGEAHLAAGADPDVVAAAVEATTNFYAPAS